MRNIFKTLASSTFYLFLITNTYSQVSFNKVDSLINFLSSDSWVWIISKGGFSGNDIYTPKEFLKNKTIKFNTVANAVDSIAFELYYDNSLVYKGSSKVSFSNSIFGTRWNIENMKGFTTREQSFDQVKYDYISFSDNCYDCYKHGFIRKSLTDFTYSVTGIVTTTTSGNLIDGGLNYSFTGIRTNQMVSFDLNTFSGYSYTWKFGDGDSSSLPLGIHSFGKKSANASYEHCIETNDIPPSSIFCDADFIVSLRITKSDGESIELNKTLTGINYQSETRKYSLVTGVSEIVNSGVRICNLGDYYKVDFLNLEATLVEIYSITGQKILKSNNVRNEIIVNKSELKSGLNVLYLEIQGIGKYFKLIK